MDGLKVEQVLSMQLSFAGLADLMSSTGHFIWKTLIYRIEPGKRGMSYYLQMKLKLNITMKQLLANTFQKITLPLLHIVISSYLSGKIFRRYLLLLLIHLHC